MALSPEEQEELEALQAETQERKQLGNNEELQMLQKEQAERKYSTAGATGKGLVQGVTMGFADEAEATLEAVSDVTFGGKPFSEFTNSYKKNVTENRRELEQAKLAHPTAFEVGDAVGSIAGVVAIPGAAAAKVGGSIALGMASGLGRSAEQDWEDDVLNTVVGGGLGLVGHGASKLLAKGAGVVARGFMSERSLQVMRSFGVLGKSQRNSIAKKFGTDIDTLADDLMDETLIVKGGIRKLLNPATEGKEQNIVKMIKSSDDLLDDVNTLIGQHSNTRNKMVEEISEEVDLAKFIGHVEADESIMKAMGSETDELATAGIGVIRKLKQELMLVDADGVAGRVTMPAKQMGSYISDLFKVTDIGGDPGMNLSRKYMQQAAGIMNNSYKSFLKDSGADKAVEMTSRIENLIAIRKPLTDKVVNMGQGFAGFMRQSMQTTGVTVGGGIVGSAFGEDAGKVGAGIGFVLNAVTTGKRAPQAMARSLQNLSKFFTATDNVFSRDLARKIAVGTAISSENMMSALGYSTAAIKFRERQLPRTTEAVIGQREDVVAFVNYEDPEAGAILEQAIEDGDEAQIAEIMEKISSTPGAKKYIEQGEGWDGKAISEEHKAELLQQIKSSKLIPSAKKDLLRRVAKTGEIMDLESLEEQAMQIRQQREPYKPQRGAAGRKRYNY